MKDDRARGVIVVLTTMYKILLVICQLHWNSTFVLQMTASLTIDNIYTRLLSI